MEIKYTEINSNTWDKWVENGIEWCIPISHEGFVNARVCISGFIRGFRY